MALLPQGEPCNMKGWRVVGSGVGWVLMFCGARDEGLVFVFVFVKKERMRFDQVGLRACWKMSRVSLEREVELGGFMSSVSFLQSRGHV